MKPVTLPTAIALLKLKAPDMAPILELLQAERTDALELMAKAGEEWQWRRAQGKAQFVEELLNLVEDSAGLAAKLSASR